MNNLNTGTRDGLYDGTKRDETSQHVTFLIDKETYGVTVGRVKEIIGMVEIVHVPNMADFMKGVINLRGIVVPLVDMRRKFKMADKEYDATTVIIIVEVGEKLIGMIVDSVSDVLDIPVATIQETPHFTTDIEAEFISGIGQVSDRMVILLDVDRILSREDLAKIDHASLAKNVA